MQTITAPVQAGQRLHALDFIRGLAVLGILIINIETFSYPNSFNPYQFGFETAFDHDVRFWVYWLFQGKSYSMFALLFGVGFCIFLDKAGKEGMKGMDIYARRILWLFVFGVLHAYLIWNGDILYHYAVCGLLLLPLRSFSKPWLLAAIVLLSVPTLYSAHSSTSRTVAQHEAYVAASDIAPDERTKEQHDQIAAWEKRRQEKPADRHDPVIEARLGGYLDNVAENARHTGVHEGKLVYTGILFRTLMLMAAGILLYRLGIFSDYRRMKGYWLVTGVLLSASLMASYYRYFQWSYEYTEPVRNYLVAYAFTFSLEGQGIAYVLLLNGLYQKFLAKLRFNPLAKAGRMALTNYLMQSVICAFIFFGYGFGMFNQYARSELLLIIAAIWAFQLAFSEFWLRNHRYGPMEWLWRKLTYGNIGT